MISLGTGMNLPLFIQQTNSVNKAGFTLGKESFWSSSSPRSVNLFPKYPE